jgi:hypothetical protein
MNKLLIILTSFSIFGCTSATPITTPDGTQGFKIWCEIPSQCYDKASEVCPSGYKIHAREKDHVGFGDIDGMLLIDCK